MRLRLAMCVCSKGVVMCVLQALRSGLPIIKVKQRLANHYLLAGIFLAQIQFSPAMLILVLLSLVGFSLANVDDF